MDIHDGLAFGRLDIDQLLVELNVLPLKDGRAESKTCDFKIDCFTPRASAWLNGPLSSSCEISSAC